MDDTDDLIARLQAQAAPVRRLRPPGARAAAWLGVVLAVGAVLIGLTANWPLCFSRLSDPSRCIQALGALATGVLAVVAAFHSSVPGRSRAWGLLPLPGVALWLGGSGAGCLQHVREAAGPDWAPDWAQDWAMHGSLRCLMWIVGFGIPLCAGLFWFIRAARPIAPVRVGVLGALGAAALAAFGLEFFHPFDVTFMDLTVHAVAVAAVIGLATAGGGRVLDGA